ncbi:hypothetical protein AZ66_19000 [Paenibacillus sp. E194]|uniref:hypothetical protein n=1 Tax=Paenibacillus sp. E194 TaxID=1458845 RepID=UPI0005C95189|nr:hypothetical protein [Paenibacillus sp. E194]KJB86417.1 hypothetical protein AZ66_19000 [Paenibacillus sp. E194]
MNTKMKIAIASQCSILLFGSMHLMSGTASDHAISGISLKVAATKPMAANEGEKLEQAEKAKLDKLLEKNPCDMYLIYSSYQPKGFEVFGYGNFNPRYEKYEDYEKLLRVMKEPAPQKPADLSKNYTFEGVIVAAPYTNEYAAALQAEAKKLGKKIYSKKLEWKDTNMIQLRFVNGKDYIQFSSYRIEEMDKNQNGYVYIAAADVKKKNPKLDPKFITTSLNWYEQGKGFSISTNAENSLTKEDLIKLATTMVKK